MSQAEPILPLVEQLWSLLSSLNSSPYPQVPNPPNCKKRASVALIIRVRPNFPDYAESGASIVEEDLPTCRRLDSFFNQSWVRRGDPEVMFIKRAARKGDRWTSHVALPGGKRDPDDDDDRATGVRETMEEIGLDLTQPHSHFVGNLPERIVTTAWGTVPLMVLCPFVFVLTRHELPPLRLQPTEVNSAHWVPLRALLASSLRTFERCDVSDRLSRSRGWLLQACFRLMLGQMLFSAVRLIPSESVYCSSILGFIPDNVKSVTGVLKRGCEDLLTGNHAGSNSRDRPLLLWGLTHGILADFLDLLPSRSTFQLWRWPTFSPWDIRIIVWLVTYSFRKRRLLELESKYKDSPNIIEGLDTLGSSRGSRGKSHRADMDGLGLSEHRASLRPRPHSGVVDHMIEGYYDLMRRAIFIAVAFRGSVAVMLAGFLLRRARHKLSTSV